MDSYKHKHALCIKNGFMASGRKFCVQGKVYKYTTASARASHKYSVKSERSNSCDHSMSDDFFEKYFIADFKHHEHVSLADDLFEI